MSLKRGKLTPLFTQEKVWEIEKYNIAKETEKRERENGIRTFVLGFKKFMTDKQNAIVGLMELYGLSQSDAENKVNLYW